MDKPKTINERAAEWWAERFMIDEKRELFRAALLKCLPDEDWVTYNDYDPDEILIVAVRAVVECRGVLFSARGILPSKTGLQREGNALYSKEGYGANWERVNG